MASSAEIEGEQVLEELRLRLGEAAKKNAAEGLLLSGGLDSGILAHFLRVPSLGVTLENRGDDLKYAQRLSQKLELTFYLRVMSIREAFEAMPLLIRMRRSFDPALPNDLALYFALKFAAEMNFKTVATGDGADELFAGYSYMFSLDLEDYLPKLAQKMKFSSGEIGSYLGIEVKQPFLDPEFISFALSIPPNIKIGEEKGRKYGKWILRKVFETSLSKEFVWQEKRPIEIGSGFTKLREVASSMISDEEFAAGQEKFLSRDHLFYYRIYREAVGEVPKPGEGEKACPACGAGMEICSSHCRVCGWSQKPKAQR
jgi:asparagine synthase (glutamine-hydrolysing)